MLIPPLVFAILQSEESVRKYVCLRSERKFLSVSIFYQYGHNIQPVDFDTPSYKKKILYKKFRHSNLPHPLIK